jgi:hypothetical protein
VFHAPPISFYGALSDIFNAFSAVCERFFNALESPIGAYSKRVLKRIPPGSPRRPRERYNVLRACKKNE